MNKISIRILFFMLFVGASASADIIVNGSSVGEAYTLTASADTVVVTSGLLTIGQNGNINTSLELSGGQINVSGGGINIANTLVSGGFLNVSNPDNVNFHSGFNASGGQIVMQEQTPGDEGGIYGMNNGSSVTISGDADVTLVDIRNVNPNLNITDTATVRFLGGSYTTSATTNSFGRVTGASDPITGSVSGLGCNVNFSVAQSAGLYVNIPEPAAVSFILVGALGMLGVKRLFGNDS